MSDVFEGQDLTPDPATMDGNTLAIVGALPSNAAGFSFHLRWSGTPVASIAMQSTGVEEPAEGDWADLELDEDRLPEIDGAAGAGAIHVSGVVARAVRLLLTTSSGTGELVHAIYRVRNR